MSPSTGGGGFSGSSASSTKTSYSGSNTFGGFNYKSGGNGLSGMTIAVLGAAVLGGLYIMRKF